MCLGKITLIARALSRFFHVVDQEGVGCSGQNGRRMMRGRACGLDVEHVDTKAEGRRKQTVWFIRDTILAMSVNRSDVSTRTVRTEQLINR